MYACKNSKPQGLEDNLRLEYLETGRIITLCFSGACEKRLLRRMILWGRYAFGAPNQGLDSGFCWGIAGQGLTQKVCFCSQAPVVCGLALTRKGTNGVSINGVTANFMFFDRGTFRILPLIYVYIPKSARGYPFLQSVKFITFAVAPLVLTPFVRNQVTAASRRARVLLLFVLLLLALVLVLCLFMCMIFINCYDYVYDVYQA